jgi:hypothetical protein
MSKYANFGKWRLMYFIKENKFDDMLIKKRKPSAFYFLYFVIVKLFTIGTYCFTIAKPVVTIGIQH